jgi:signal transduction histidine kinase/CheY-like chemotaxis protein
VASDYPVPIGQGFSGRVAATGRPWLLTGDSITATVRSPWLRARGLRALYGAPLVHDGEVIGVALIGSAKNDSFSQAELRVFQAMAQRASWAVSRSQARRRVYELFEAAPVAMAVFRPPEFTCVFANRSCRDLFGGEDLVGREAFALGTAPDAVARLESVIRDGEGACLEDVPLQVTVRGTGPPEERFFRVSLHPLRDAMGQPEAVLAVNVDLTAEVLARRALEASRREAHLANHTKDEFLATLAHELRTPVSGILGWTARARVTGREQPRAIEAIERSALAQLHLLDDMLDIARIASGRLRLEIAPADIARVLLDAVDAVRPAAEAKCIALDVRLGQDLGLFALDAGRIQQVVWNLLSNAAKFTPERGSVRLSAARTAGAGVVVSVSDSGEGIDARVLPHVFEPFRQGDSSTARVHRGLGLGLAIAKQLVAAHGGSIRAESEGPGKGATFTLELPARAIAAISGWAEPDPPARPLALTPALGLAPVPSGPGEDAAADRLAGARILVVDDEAEALELIARVLESAGARVHTSATAGDALQKMRVFRPDMIVSDLAMPQTDGYALIRNIRALPMELGGRTPAIALSARALADERQRAFTAGFEAHIPKPVDAGELVSRVSDLLTRHDAADAERPDDR